MKRQTKFWLGLIIYVLIWILTLIVFPLSRATAEAPISTRELPTEIASDPIKSYAYEQVKYAWGIDQWDSFNNIIEHESDWNPKSQNPTSTAYGLGQFLNSTWKWMEYTKTDDPKIQIHAIIKYIETVYGTPDKAWSVWQKQKWY